MTWATLTLMTYGWKPVVDIVIVALPTPADVAVHVPLPVCATVTMPVFELIAAYVAQHVPGPVTSVKSWCCPPGVLNCSALVENASVGSGVGEGVGVGVGVGEGVAVGAGVGVGVGDGVDVGAGVAVGVGVGDAVGRGVGDVVGVAVGDAVGVGVGDGESAATSIAYRTFAISVIGVVVPENASVLPEAVSVAMSRQPVFGSKNATPYVAAGNGRDEVTEKAGMPFNVALNGAMNVT